MQKTFARSLLEKESEKANVRDIRRRDATQRRGLHNVIGMAHSNRQLGRNVFRERVALDTNEKTKNDAVQVSIWKSGKTNKREKWHWVTVNSCN